MPPNEPHVPFRELVAFAIGGGWGNESPGSDDTKVAVIRGTDFANVVQGRLESVPIRYEKTSKVKSRALKPGDLVLEISGGSSAKGQATGRSLYVSAQWLDRFEIPIIPASFCRLVRPDVNKVEPRYAYFALQDMHKSGRAFEYEHRSTGISNFQFEHFLDTEQVRLPSRDEQRAIAHILVTLDDKIELNRRMNETLEAIARAIFKSWFVDFDPVHAKASGEPPESICRRLGLTLNLLALFPDRLVDFELGEIPEGWVLSTLAEQAHRCGGAIQTGPFGSQLHASDYVEEGVPVVMPQDLVNRRVSTHRIARICEEDAARLSRHRLLPGDIVYSRRGDVERHAVISKREAGWLCGTGCLLVRLGPAWPSQAFLSLALDRPETREWIVRHAVGATMPNLNTTILGKMPLLVPPDSLNKAFDLSISAFSARRDALESESETLTELRDTLLPKLLAGDVRLPAVSV